MDKALVPGHGSRVTCQLVTGGGHGYGWGSRVTGHGSWVMGRGSRVTGNGLRVTGHGLWGHVSCASESVMVGERALGCFFRDRAIARARVMVRVYHYRIVSDLVKVELVFVYASESVLGQRKGARWCAFRDRAMVRARVRLRVVTNYEITKP